jgi:predicted enzyme related to lactoylglutathione lyase
MSQPITLHIRRITLFVSDVPAVAQFYRDVLGLLPKPSPDDEREWQEFYAGPGVSIALHAHGAPPRSKRPPKLVFYAQDVPATRAQLIAQGAKLGRVVTAGEFCFCDGKDPEGNPFQISSRV